ncbi:Astacin-like metalloendopeptidase [Halotydeus destructor]|nr:Astacin-like metalloendopeptidase [Halotydeus destructor]
MDSQELIPELIYEVNENTINADYFRQPGRIKDDKSSTCEEASDLADQCPVTTGGPEPQFAVIREDEGQKVRWVGEKVRFYIGQNMFSKREIDLISKAMGVIQRSSCVRFQQVKSMQDDIIYIHKTGPICAADVGRKYFENSYQRLMLGKVCFNNGFGPVLHELYHILGFYHEHMRPDRDTFIGIIWDNVDKRFKHNFNKASDSIVETFGQPYDLGSIMHYGLGDFAKTKGLPTLQPKSSVNFKIGQRNQLSPLDVLKLNMAYQCGGALSLSTRPTQQPVTYKTTARWFHDDSSFNNLCLSNMAEPCSAVRWRKSMQCRLIGPVRALGKDDEDDNTASTRAYAFQALAGHKDNAMQYGTKKEAMLKYMDINYEIINSLPQLQESQQIEILIQYENQINVVSSRLFGLEWRPSEVRCGISTSGPFASCGDLKTEPPYCPVDNF